MVQVINSSSAPLDVSLFGAMPGTGNLGVSALCFSTVAGILKRLQNTNLTVFGFDNEIHTATYITDQQTYRYTAAGAVYSRRYYRRNNLWNMLISSMFGGLGNPSVNIVAKAQAVLDLSQGDSFTDMYGFRRFNIVTFPKLIALQQKRPLIFTPTNVWDL